MLGDKDFERTQQRLLKADRTDAVPRGAGAGRFDRFSWGEGDVEIVSEPYEEETPKPTKKAAN